MGDSAGPTLRERRKAETSARISAVARRLTAARGLQGFTVEEVCEEVGVSRRTFFNYFHSKDDAIVGRSVDALDETAVDAFLAARPGGLSGISPRLLDDLADLTIASLELIGLTPEMAASFIAAVEREPQLLSKMIRSGTERDRALMALVEHREGLEPGDARAEAAVLITGALFRASAERFLRPGNTEPFDVLVRRGLDAARAVFSA